MNVFPPSSVGFPDKDWVEDRYGIDRYGVYAFQRVELFICG